MADVSKRRRRPKGTSSGGEFAKENKAKSAGDLNEDPFEANGLGGLNDEAKTMARIMAARGGTQVYEDLAKYNEAIGYHPGDAILREPAAPVSAPFEGVPLAVETLSTLVESGVTDFRGADLHGLDLTDYDLKGLNLDGVNLTDARLDRTDLSGASMRNAILDDATLDRVKTDGLVLDGASMIGVDMTDVEFGDEDSLGAGVSLRDADMTGAVLDRVSFQPNADMTGVILRESEATGIYIVPDRSENLNLGGARWHGGHLCLDYEADFTGGSFLNFGGFLPTGFVRDADLTDSMVCDEAATFVNCRINHRM